MSPVEHLWRSREWHAWHEYDILVTIVGPEMSWVYGCFSATPDQLVTSIVDRVALLSGEGMPSAALASWRATVKQAGQQVVYAGFERLEGPYMT